MFRFDRTGGYGGHHVVDDDRRVSLRTLGGITYESATPAILSWDGRQIPLEFDDHQRTDPLSGQAYTLYRFDTFGHSWTASRRSGIPPYTFSSPTERAHALLLAVEAVLVDRFRYVDGDWNVDAVRVGDGVGQDGQVWRASDFGYRTAADIGGGTRAPTPAADADHAKPRRSCTHPYAGVDPGALTKGQLAALKVRHDEHLCGPCKAVADSVATAQASTKGLPRARHIAAGYVGVVALSLFVGDAVGDPQLPIVVSAGGAVILAVVTRERMRVRRSAAQNQANDTEP